MPDENFDPDSDAPERDPHLGRVLDERYRVEALIGAGGMGTIYQGVDLHSQREVAIKVLRTERIAPAQLRLAAQRFRREAEVTGRLRHPNTVRMYDFGTIDDKQPYLVLERLRGHPLSDAISKGPIAATEAANVCRQVALSLAEAHALQIVHRDIKPENIFLSRLPGGDEIVKVMDFGVAHIPRDDEDVTRLTGDRTLVGSPHYMSPEQADGLELGPASDLYSLGVVLYECLSGERPFSGATELQIIVAHVGTPAPEVPVGPDVPEHLAAGLKDLVRRLLAKAPEERPASATAVAAELGRLVEGRGTPAATPPPGGSAGLASQQTQDDVPPSWRRRRRVPIWAAMAGAAALVGGLALALVDMAAPAGPEPVVVVPGDTGAIAPTSQAPDRPTAEQVAPPPEPVRATEPPPTTLAVRTTPPGALVVLGDDQLLCETPCTHALPSTSGDATLTFRKDGYQPAQLEVQLAPNGRVERTVELRPVTPEPAPRRKTVKSRRKRKRSRSPSASSGSKQTTKKRLLPQFRKAAGSRTKRD